MSKLIKFSRVGCTPCKILGNHLDSIGVSYEEVDVEEDLATSTKYGISGLPTLLLVDEEGEVLDRAVGYNPNDKTEVEKLISKL